MTSLPVAASRDLRQDGDSRPRPEQHISFGDEPQQTQRERSSSRPQPLQIPKNRSWSSLLSTTSSGGASLRTGSDSGGRLSLDAGSSAEAYESLTRSPILAAHHDTGLRRIRQPPTPRVLASPSLSPLLTPAEVGAASRKTSLPTIPSGLSSPTLPFSEDLARFPTESLHSFSFAQQSGDSLHNRQNVLKRSIEFMRDKLGWAATSPRIASAQAKLNGDEELLSMMELLQRANINGMESFGGAGLATDRGFGGHGLGPLTGPAHLANENVFDRSFMPEVPEKGESPDTIRPEKDEAILGSSEQSISPVNLEPPKLEKLPSPIQRTLSPIERVQLPEGSTKSDTEALTLQWTITTDDMPGVTPQNPQRSSLKRTYTDVAGYSLQRKLTDALAQPYHSDTQSSALTPTHAPTISQPITPRGGSLAERAPHGHRHQQAQAIFTTEARAPWTITAANDLACLVFGVTRAEVRKLGIMEVIKPERRKWLEDKLRNPDVGPTTRAKPEGSPNGNGLAGMGNGVTAKLLNKPPARQTYQSRRSKTENGVMLPPKRGPNHNSNKSRGVLLCGDVVPIQKMNGSTGSASLWVKEKGGNLVWVLEEIAEDVALISLDEIGSVLKGSGDIEAIWGLERLRNGMDIIRLIPAFPKLAGTNTGAIDYDAVAQLHRFTARTSNSISIPITVDQLSGESTFRVSSFPHIAGIMVLHPRTMKVSSSNNVFSAALFGYQDPNGMPITDLIPQFDKILNVMTDEDEVALVDGIVIPEHSFRRARSLLAMREGSADAAAIFLRPSGIPAKHRDGAEIMIDVQMRVVKSDRDPIYNEHVIAEDGGEQRLGSEIVYALWITYSRQLHAVNHGIGHVIPLMSRPGTPPQQPGPGAKVDEVVPSPRIIHENGDEEMRVSLLTAQLEESKRAEGAQAGSAGESEPFEHPSPDMIKAGVKCIKKKKVEDFTILEEMGQGAYGQVKLARYKKAAAKKMVIKYVTKRRILVDTWHRDRRLGTVPLEIHVLDYLRREGMQHPNIVEMADFFEDDINYYIEMLPHGLPGMDLFDYIELRVTMEERECRGIFKQVAEAVRHLHVNAKVVHRDIKDENVILDGEGRVKLVDFGSAAYIKSGPFDVFVGTIDYAAPEVLRGLPYRGKEQDVWALGILLYTIVYKENPFYSIDEIMDHDLRVPYVMSEECIDLIRKMLDRDVERRIVIQDVLSHPWCLVVDEVDEGPTPGKGSS
ncbi:Pkinase-domain-containing protein [Teratosphaeria nubilosa]|uniref:non-specific serine/threonine protein kinase n=1 Tax=Teratosphaeria nubilosa TaxID=161662 RepID=A0A6G1L4A3_9PEZI|nr:Pkinase-domain-containing protein [Teratosphaeria nubilosa]